MVTTWLPRNMVLFRRKHLYYKRRDSYCLSNLIYSLCVFLSALLKLDVRYNTVDNCLPGFVFGFSSKVSLSFSFDSYLWEQHSLAYKLSSVHFLLYHRSRIFRFVATVSLTLLNQKPLY